MATLGIQISQVAIEFIVSNSPAATTYPVKITLRGVKRSQTECKSLEVSEVPQAPHVTRAV
jgi:hypothetical protein